MTLDELAARFRGPVKRDPHGLTAFCPAHADGSTQNRPSLRLTETPATGWLHVRCWAGCAEAAILAAADLTLADLEPVHGRNGSRGVPQSERRIVATYDYHDTDGSLAYQVVRYEPKDFRQRRPDGTGGWMWDMKGRPRLLYHLPDLKGAPMVYIAEGEKDTDTLRTLGLVATTNTGGAGKWTAGDTAALLTAGVKAVVILPDNDPAGETHAAKISASCRGAGLEVRIVRLPGLGPKQDVSDWLAAGHTRADLEALVSAAPVGEPPIEAPAPPAPFTDMANAARFAQAHVGFVHYCWALRAWFVFDGTRWLRDADALLLERAKATARTHWPDAVARPAGEERKRALRFAEYSESARGLAAMLDLARSEPGVPIGPEDFDAYPELLNTPSGTVDLRTGTQRPHARADYCSQMTAAAYVPGATDPALTRVLETMFPDKVERAYAQTVLGYSATGSTALEQAYLLHGPTAGGKTTLLESVKAALGDYALAADFETFRPRKHESAPREDLVRLHRARLVVVAETREQRLDAAVLKRMTGGDTNAGRQLYRGTEEYRPISKIWMAGNVRPLVQSDDESFFRRLREIPVPRSLGPEERDPTVKATLTDSQTGGRAVLAWVVEGARHWLLEGVKDSPAVQAATAAYRAAMDHDLGEFVAEQCIAEAEAWVSRSEVREALTTWLRAEGVQHPPTGKAVAASLRQAGAQDRQRNGQRGWLGLRLRTAADPDLKPTPAGASATETVRPW